MASLGSSLDGETKHVAFWVVPAEAHVCKCRRCGFRTLGL